MDARRSQRGALLDQINAKAVVHETVTLSSGRQADYYVDLRRITLDAEAAPLVGRVMLELTDDLRFDAVEVSRWARTRWPWP